MRERLRSRKRDEAERVYAVPNFEGHPCLDVGHNSTDTGHNGQGNGTGSRMGPRGGISSSTPPRGANRARMALARSFPLEVSSSSAALKIALASCSIDLPLSAARMRKRRIRPLSKLRTVILAKTVPPSAAPRYSNLPALQSPQHTRLTGSPFHKVYRADSKRPHILRRWL